MKLKNFAHIILFILLLMPFSVLATEWAKVYGGNDNDYALSVQQTTDGGYIVGGYTRSFGAGNYDCWILKLDSGGNITWQKTYGGSGEDVANSIQQTTDGGYIVAGYTESFGAGYFDCWILKLDSGGNVTWQKTYGDGGGGSACFIQQTTDGGYIVAGGAEPFGADYDFDFSILKTDSNGEISGCDRIKISNVSISNTSVTSGNSSIVGSTSNASIGSPDIQQNVTSAVVKTICPNTSSECSAWSDVIAKYQEYVSGQADWSEVITCYNQYVSP